MKQIPVKVVVNPRNTDGTFKTIDQIIRAQMTVLQYGQYLASTQKRG
jgi:hypothetical protein